MKLRTIRVESFKRFRDPMALEGLQPGINLIAAPNGKGKSTLAEAVRVGFLERHRTGSLGDSLAPWTQPGASPSLQIEFERDGKIHILQKVFGGKKSCTLQVDGQAPLTGEAAEDKLGEMFSFSYAKRDVSRPELQGVPGLLWVRQGTSGQILDQAEAAHDYISRALGDGVSELAATAGDQVIERVEKELAELHTKGGKPTSDYARLITRLTELEAQEQQLKAKVQEYVQCVDRYTALQQQQAKGERERRWEALRVKVTELRGEQEALNQIASQVRELRLRVTVAEGQITNCESDLQAMDQEDQAVSTREAEVQAAEEIDATTLALVRAAETRLNTAREADTVARLNAVRARESAMRRRAQEALEVAGERVKVLKEAVLAVQGKQQELHEQRAEESRLSGFTGAGAKLQKAQADLQTALARLEAVSTRLEYDLQGGSVTLAGEQIHGAGALNLTQPTEIAVAGVGVIRVLPGAKDLAQLQRDVQHAEEGLTTLLRTLGVQAPEQALQSEQELQTVRTAIGRLEGSIAGMAPAGVDRLGEQAATAEGDEQRCKTALASLPQGPEDEIEVLPEAAAQQLETAAQETLKHAQQAYDEARTEATTAKEQLRLARIELEAARAKVGALEREQVRKGKREEQWTAMITKEGLDSEIQALQRQVDAANPQVLAADIQRYTQSADAQQLAHGRTVAELNQLAGQLQAQGALGLEEQAAAAGEEVARVDRQVEDRRRRAAALTHLRDLLLAKRAELARSIRAPLQKHMNHYLAIQFPGTQIELDEKLRPHRIVRQGVHGSESGTFDELSGGEREQVGVIARFAYADLLKESGKPTLLMLDDSLVNCDLDRLAQMKRVIYDAAKRHQILIFTCHGEKWQDMGVAPITLQ